MSASISGLAWVSTEANSTKRLLRQGTLWTGESDHERYGAKWYVGPADRSRLRRSPRHRTRCPGRDEGGQCRECLLWWLGWHLDSGSEGQEARAHRPRPAADNQPRLRRSGLEDPLLHQLELPWLREPQDSRNAGD